MIEIWAARGSCSVHGRIILALWSGLLYMLADCMTGCTSTPVEPTGGLASRTEALYVISGGWHTELGLQLATISGPLAALKPEFPSARYLVFGWGARDYYMARNPGMGDVLRALAPGPAVMLVIPLEMAPEAVFGVSNAFVVHVRGVGSNVSRNFCGAIWSQTRKGRPTALEQVPIPRASSMPPLGPTISATPATHGRPRRCVLPACP